MSAVPVHGRRRIRRVCRLLAPGLIAIFVAGAFHSVTPAHAADGPVAYIAVLSGPAEDPPNASPATGSARVDIDLTAHTMRVRFDFTGLVGTLTAAHIHACTATPLVGTAGVATQTPTFVGTPVGTTSGSYDTTFDTVDAATYSASYLTAQGSPEAAEVALSSCMAVGGAYLNLHSTAYPGGEIRGFLLVDTDADGLADVDDLDDDGDGQSDTDETECGSDPLDADSLSPDTDGDGVPDCVDPTPGTTTSTTAQTTTTDSTTTTTTTAPGTTTDSTTTTTPSAVGTPTSLAATPSATLPSTGADSGMTGGALTLIVAGALLVLGSRRGSSS